MKWLSIGASIVMTGAVLFCGCRLFAHFRDRKTDNSETVECDGGVVTHFDTDAPKTIESTEITVFKCEFSLIDAGEPDELGNAVYTLEAYVKDGVVAGSIESYDRYSSRMNATFETDITFMEKLQEIAVKYSLAELNGQHYKVSGLPEMYGSKLSVEYASGESIYAYNNQSRFLSYECMKELVDLFAGQDKQ